MGKGYVVYMREKKNILFVIESLALAGSEKSLISLLSNIDPRLYNIDLQLFAYGKELEKFIPSYVNLLPPLPYTIYGGHSWEKSVTTIFRKQHFSFFKAKFLYFLSLKTRRWTITEKAKLYWEKSKSVFSVQEKYYDIAIAFAQGVPTFYVLDKIKAGKRIAWVNANVQFTTNNFAFQEHYYNNYDCIVPISEGTKQHLEEIFPHLSVKYKVIPNIVDYNSICQMATLYRPSFSENYFNILTVSRLDNGMKGMDITMETCKILRDKGVKFHWYILGSGSFKEEMELYMEKHQLKNNLTLLGPVTNPYPYFKAADLYVQTSRHEGFGRAIAEARLLNTPVVTTRFDTVFNQMVHEKNGLVTEMDANSVSEAIIRIMQDKELYNSIIEYLKKEDKENTETVDKFNQLILDKV